MRRCVTRDASFVALLAAASLVAVDSFSFSSVFGGASLGLRAQQSAFCAGSAPCLKATPVPPALRQTIRKDGE